MARIAGALTPKYRKHKASGQALVTIAGRDHYLGPWKSKASRAEYDRLIGEWLAAGRPTTGLAVANELSRAWALALEGELSEELREELRQAAPVRAGALRISPPFTPQELVRKGTLWLNLPSDDMT